MNNHIPEQTCSGIINSEGHKEIISVYLDIYIVNFKECCMVVIFRHIFVN